MRAKTDPNGHTSTTLAVSIERCADLPGGVARRASPDARASLPAEAGLKTLAATIKARWVCEQAHQQLKEELGLDHFEGRSWRGLHRHALMAMIAYAFLQHLRLAAASGEKKSLGRPASTDAASHPKSRRRRPGPRSALPMPTLPHQIRARILAWAWLTNSYSVKVVLAGLAEARRSAKTPGFPRLDQG